MTFDAVGSTFTLNGRRFTDFIEGDKIAIDFPNDATKKTRGQDGNYSMKKTANADEMNMTISLLKASGDDSFLNGLLNQELAIELEGSLQTPFKRDGSDGIEDYSLVGGGITTRTPSSLNTVDGDDTFDYVINFATARRSV